MFCSVILLFKFVLCVLSTNCGYKSCPHYKNDEINIHLVPHSHDDVGWLKTVNQYFYGSKTFIQRAGVQYILDSVIQALLQDPKRRFIYVESAFFFKWWGYQTPELQDQVKILVNEGRLEFVGGAWSMNDEATTHYQSIIDQFSWGLRRLNETFGECGRPRVGWQIDPFGHSREMASLFAQMGFDGQFIARIDWVEKGVRFKNLEAEIIWQTSESLSANLFTGLLYNHYSAPPGFCFDILCEDDPIIDGSDEENNVDDKMNQFIKYIEKLSKAYRSNNLLIPMGDDFNYQNANINFQNMDKLIKYANERINGTKINVFYSTPFCYLKSLHLNLLTWPTKTQDFFPYSTDWHSYWTGYYTSRPTQKRFERDGNHFLQVSKQLTAFAKIPGPNVAKLSEAMSEMQHHDAITGTEKQHVADDYNRKLYKAMVNAQKDTKTNLQKITNLTSAEFESCFNLNISVCLLPSQASKFTVTLFNPLSHSSSQYVRVPVPGSEYFVKNSKGEIVSSQIIEVPWPVTVLPFRSNKTNHEIVFQVHVKKLASFDIIKKQENHTLSKNIIESQLKSHHHKRLIKNYLNILSPASKTTQKSTAKAAIQQNEIENRVLKNEHVKLEFSASGQLINIEMDTMSERIRQEFCYYQSAAGNNQEFKNRSSGAYIFRPVHSATICINKPKNVSYTDGSLVKEVHQIFNNWISQVIRIYRGNRRIEFEWLIGPIPIDDGVGKEIITRFRTSIYNGDVFYTDGNGREMMKRVRNQREYFQPNMTEWISGNYYPITSRIVIQKHNKRLAILTDRAQGGSSIYNGSLELMLHRRILNDDAFGVGEALNETQYGNGLVCRGKYYLLIGSPKHSIAERLTQLELLLPFWKFFSSLQHQKTENVDVKPDFSQLPSNVNVLTYELRSDLEILIRFENYLDKTETSQVKFNIRSIFDDMQGNEIIETTLDGSMRLEKMRRMDFAFDGNQHKKPKHQLAHQPINARKEDSEDKFNIVLKPMQIRTFIVRL